MMVGIAEAFTGSDHAGVNGLRPPRVLVFDSGLGGLTVLAEVRAALPRAGLVYAADDAVFPYGRLDEDVLIERVGVIMERLVVSEQPDVVVIACNTASVSVLPPLRSRWAGIAVVGTVPAIKSAVALSKSRCVSVLATPGAVARQYTRDLVAQFADDCVVTLVGAPRLAALAEAAMRGETVADDEILGEIGPAFVETADGRRTDAVALACTHFPLLLDTLRRVAPWPVAWIDPAPAIARRVAQVAADRGFVTKGEGTGEGTETHPITAIFTSGRPPAPALAAFLAGRGLLATETAPF